MESVSVRTLAEFAYPGGSIQTQSRVRKLEREGMIAHRQVQTSRPESYQAEVPIELVHDAGDIQLLIRGRIDGFYPGGGGGIDTIEEIKSTAAPLGEIRPREVHLAQAKLYAAIHVKIADAGYARIHLTYVQAESGEERVFEYLCDRNELAGFYTDIVDRYLEHLRALIRRQRDRDASVAATPFPFERKRAGQDEFMAAVTAAIGNGEKLFVRAPTGIGKTAAALFPALKSMAAGDSGTIFYLSARTTAQENAEECLSRICSAGALIRSVTITAKAKICFLGLEICEPDSCPFADGYYGRLPQALAKVKHDGGGAYTRKAVEAVARELTLCPYELSLDIALLCDVIICDYNYVFDPAVYLRRFFLENDTGRIVLLIDEAHNLIDRAMDMFSVAIRKKYVLAAMREIDAAVHPSLSKVMKAMNKYFIGLKKTMREEELSFWVAEELDDELSENVERSLELFPDYFSRLRGDPIPAAISDFYRAALRFSIVAELKGDGHKVYAESARDVSVTIRCLDPSGLLRKRTDACRSTVFFSATLTPFEYFTALLDGGEDAGTLNLESPFPLENLRVFIDPRFSTRYRDREMSLRPLVEYVEIFSKRGNCIFFFPSYEYLEMTLMLSRKEKPGIEILAQQRGMDDLGRRDFLASFVADHPEGVLAFAVLGGVFGEGIDLVGERLVAAVIVGVGMPPLSDEKNLMKEYFDERFGKGFLFAYTYPGMNRVLQAAGRVIRGETDKGTVLFVGQRFGTNGYRRLLTAEYQHAVTVTAQEQVAASLSKEKPARGRADEQASP
ncbi:MAG: ATP-dependent DNA helicase [Spirochaetales bacterium]|nr:ATP-dependent DNA helicase [Spirochaetales bacterium]